MANYSEWLELWPYAVLMIVFASWALYHFLAPASWRDWTGAGLLEAFIIALYAEMYGFPLTIYLLSGWLQTRYPGVDFFAHDAGHLLETLFGWRGNPHFGPFHLLSYALLGAGFVLLSAAWKVLYHAQRRQRLATDGPYARIRHPQYVAFVLIMLGFLVQWPTLLTLLMFPVLLWMYLRLAWREEREVEKQFGDVYRRYAAATPAFFPHLGQLKRGY